MKRGVKKGQVWIETVVYTLIAFVILGGVLTFAKPKVEELQDKAIIERSLEMMKLIDSTINEIKNIPGNTREIEVGIKKGSLTIDGENNLTIFSIDSRYTYSEPNQEYKEGNIIIFNEKRGDINKINITMNYSNYNITWNNEEIKETLGSSPTPYRLLISSKDNSQINFQIK